MYGVEHLHHYGNLITQHNPEVPTRLQTRKTFYKILHCALFNYNHNSGPTINAKNILKKVIELMVKWLASLPLRIIEFQPIGGGISVFSDPPAKCMYSASNNATTLAHPLNSLTHDHADIRHYTVSH
jgi:hypothetical protein